MRGSKCRHIIAMQSNDDYNTIAVFVARSARVHLSVRTLSFASRRKHVHVEICRSSSSQRELPHHNELTSWATAFWWHILVTMINKNVIFGTIRIIYNLIIALDVLADFISSKEVEDKSVVEVALLNWRRLLHILEAIITLCVWDINFLTYLYNYF